MAAFREMFEETGLTEEKFEFHEKFRKKVFYNTRRGPKQVTFFLAYLKNPTETITLRPTEHQSFKWFNFEDACNQCKLNTNRNLSILLQDAEKFIDKMV